MLAKYEIPIIPTEFIYKSEDLFTDIKFDEKKPQVLKPIISGSGENTFLIGSNETLDIDKIKKIGFTKCFDKAPYFKEASLVLICRKVSKTDMTNSIIYDNSIKEKEYGTGDYHYMYNGIIEKVLVKDSYE